MTYIDVFIRVRVENKHVKDIHNAILSELYEEIETLYKRKVEE